MGVRGRLLTQKFDGQFLKRSAAGDIGAPSPGRLRSGIPSQVQNLQVSETLARQLASDVDLLPSFEAIGGGPVALELAVWVSQGRHEVCLDHCAAAATMMRPVVDKFHGVFNGAFVKTQRGGNLGGREGLRKIRVGLSYGREGGARSSVGCHGPDWRVRGQALVIGKTFFHGPGLGVIWLLRHGHSWRFEEGRGGVCGGKWKGKREREGACLLAGWLRALSCGKHNDEHARRRGGRLV